MSNSAEELSDLINQKIEALRPRLLDLSRRNPLLSIKLTARGTANLRVVDELPDILYFNLTNGRSMRLAPLPSLDEDPKDEATPTFKRALANGRLTDASYLAALAEIDKSADDHLDRTRTVERALKDRIRGQLNLSPRLQKNETNLAQHARNNGIAPGYDLPDPESSGDAEKHQDLDIQSLLLPEDLERKLSSLSSKCNTWIQETGVNVLHVAFGFLEWSEPKSSETSFAPLILLPAKLGKRKSPEGAEFWIAGLGEEAEVNTVLAEKLRLEFGVQLPAFSKRSAEDYFKEVAALSPKSVTWRVRRQVVIGVFPSARMAMYHDLNTQNAKFGEHDVIRPLFGGGTTAGASPFADEYKVDEPHIEKLVPTLVMDADASQFSTLADVASGNNVAVEGPPGTGKSQTIVNTIAAAIASGKKVLFVAEKMAALNVVRSRLEAIGLGELLMPLQAERSTREQVIQSIRDRIEMEKTQPPRNYEAQIAEFRETRAETARYIEILASAFEDSGLTVHDILGKSLVTGGAIDALPKKLQLAIFPIRQGLSVASISDLAAKGDQLEKAWDRASAAPPFWAAIGRFGFHRFDVDEILDLASELSARYRELDAAARRLQELRISGLDYPAALPALIQASEAARSLGTTPTLSLLPSLLARGTADALKAFADACQQHAARAVQLQGLFRVEVGQEVLTALDELASLCRAHEIAALDNASLEQAVASKRQAAVMARRLAEQVRPFADQIPGSENWRFSDIGAIRKLLAEIGADVLQRRTPTLADAAATDLIRSFNETGRRLRCEWRELEDHFSSHDLVSIEQLADAVAALRDAGLFAFFKGSYRQAVRLYRRVARAKFRRDDACSQLERLIAWKRREGAFGRDSQAMLLYGVHFRGLDTDFDLFDRITNYYIAVRTTFAAVEQRPQRDFLINGDAELILLTPALDAYPEGVRLRLIDEGIERLEAAIAVREQASQRVRELTVMFHPSQPPRADALSDLGVMVADHLREQRILDHDARMAALLGPAFAGCQTETRDLGALASLVQAIAGFGAGAESVARALAAGHANEILVGAIELQQAFSATHAQMSLLDDKAALGARSILKHGSFTERADNFALAARDRDGLIAHAECAAARAGLDPILSDFVQAYFDVAGSFKSLGKILEGFAYRALARRAYEKHGQLLAKYSGAKLNTLRARLAELDRQIIDASRRLLRANAVAAARPPHGIGVGRKSTWTEMALIDHETSKKQKFISVRDLTRRAARALLELKPCWMMSPLAVAQYLPKGQLSFDLCIIDEASQMTPEDAVGALARCRQAMVVGDTNQLPPSSFFRKMIDDEETDEDETVLNESILEMANGAFRPARRLRWHYRSRHSGLIKFSNRMVYDDSLVIFPSAAEEQPGMGVALHAVNGLYKAGTNPIEAQRMVEAALRFVKEQPHRSLGIVTLNQKQSELVEQEWKFAVERDPDAARYVDYWAEKNDGLEPFFIKNLENVQGDERDVIFIGTVYGPEQPGARVMQRFGPINGVAGKRRLNVLFSRAKQQVVTFSSMRAADILAEENGNPGAYMLRRWLEYAATGMLESGEVTQKEPDSDLEIYVVDQIRAMGCIPVPQVGVKGYSIDIGVRHPQWPHGFILGVECDGAAFHSSKSARDRDRLRQEVLEGLGWRFHRIWSTDWFNDPGKQAAILRQVIADRLAELKAMEARFARPMASQATRFAAVDEPVEQSPVALSLAGKPNGAQRPAAVEMKVEPAVDNRPNAVVASQRNGNGRVSVGDTVRVRYLTDDKHVVQFTISADKSDPSNNVVHCRTPIAEALLGAEEGDEVEILVRSYLKPAVLEKIVSRTH